MSWQLLGNFWPGISSTYGQELPQETRFQGKPEFYTAVYGLSPSAWPGIWIVWRTAAGIELGQILLNVVAMSQRIADCLEVIDLARSFAHGSPTSPASEWRQKAIAHVASRGVTTNTVFAHLVGKGTRHTLSAEGIDRLISGWVNNNSSELQHWIMESSSGAESERISQFFSGSSVTPVASDIDEPEETERHLVSSYRVLRDTALARRIKAEMDFTCQQCGVRIMLADGTPYAEAHHVKPLGTLHNGPDHPGNIICVCPNCHVMFDYGAISANIELLPNVLPEFIRYHNEVIVRKTPQKAQ